MVKDEAGARRALRDWVVRTSGKISEADLRDDTPLLEERLITSLHVLDLILLLEELTGNPIDVSRLKPGAFRNIDTIVRGFWSGGVS